MFLDKDGTLVEDVPYNVDPARMRLVAGAGEALSRLAVADYRLFVVTNQSGVARGYFEEPALVAVEARLRELLHPFGVELAGFYYCPHHPDGVVPGYAVRCSCRKPEPGLFFEAARDHNVDLAISWAIGDILDDIEAGRRAGCRTILLARGHETEWVWGAERVPHHVARHLWQAQKIILAVDGASMPASMTRSEAPTH